LSDIEANPDMQLAGNSRRRRVLRAVAWLLAGAAMLAVLIAISIAILLHSERFHNYVLRTVQQKASESLGVRVELQNFALNLSHLGLDLYGITVDGAAPYANPPLLQVDHVEVGVRVVSVLHGKWYLDSFQVDRPIVRIFVDAHGKSNIPVFKRSSNSSSNTSLFDLAIRRAILDRGEVYYNDQASALTADLHDVEFRASFNALLQKYSGHLAYSDGHLISGLFRPIPHNLDAEFDATPTTFHLSRAKLSLGPSQVLLTATVQNYSNPNVDGQYDVIVDGEQAGQILKNASVPMGQIHAAGSLHYQQIAKRSLLDSLMVTGDLESRQLNVKTTYLRTQITNLAAHYSLNNGNATVERLSLHLLGGELTANGQVNNVGGDSHAKVNGNLRGVSLAALRSMAQAASPVGNIALQGALNAQIDASWGKNLDSLVAHTDATIHGNVESGGQAQHPDARKPGSGSVSEPALSIDSAIHATYTASNQQIEVLKSYLRTPQTNLTLNGTVGNHSSLGVRLQADDLREVETIADIFIPSSPGHPMQPLGLAGTASFDGTVQGSTASPQIEGEFLASSLHVHGSEWKVLRAHVEASPSAVNLQHGYFEPASGGHISLDASTGLAKWSFTQMSPVQVTLDASQLNIGDFAKLIGQQVPVSGKLSAAVKVHGTELSPIGTGKISIASLTAYGQPISSATVNFAGTGDEAHAELALQSLAGSIQGKLSVRLKDKTYSANLVAASIKLEKLQALKAQKIDANGELSLHASSEGSFDNPKLDATLQIPKLAIQNQTLSGINLQANIADHIANATLSSSAMNTNVQAKAKVQLTGDYLADVSLDTQPILLQPILAIYAPEQAANVTGQTEVHATLHGPLKNKNLLEAHLSIPTLKMAYGSSIQLAATAPIRADYKNGVVVLQRSAIQGTDTNLQFQGSIPIAGIAASDVPMSMTLLGTLNLQLAQLFDPDVRTSGELKFNINSSGAANDPNVGGQIEVVEAAFASGDLPVGLQHGNGVLTLTRNRLNITKFQGAVGGGTVTAQGGVALQPSIRFDVGLSARGIRMLYPQGVRESVNADLRFSGSPDASLLGGSVNLSDVSFTSAFDLNGFINQFSSGVASPPTPGFSQNLQLNLAVRSSNDVNLVSRTLSVDGSANLQVRGTASTPVILGRVNLNSGDIILNGDRFLLEGGTIEFVNPSETQPVVNVSLKTTIQQYDVYLRFNGPVDQLHTNYSSDPALPSADIINLLAFGETTEAQATNSANTTTNQGAESLVASQVSSQVTSRISKIAGISQLSINPLLNSGTSQGTGANITIQQRVTGNLFVTFSSTVAATQSQTIQGQYQLSPRVAVSATRDQNGGVAFDVIMKKAW
jgi:translocation and assembly module TamB